MGIKFRLFIMAAATKNMIKYGKMDFRDTFLLPISKFSVVPADPILCLAFWDIYENTITVKWESNSSETIKNTVISNIGVTVISKMMVEEELRDQRLNHIKIDDIKFKRKFNIICHKNKYISKQLQNFWDLIIHRFE